MKPVKEADAAEETESSDDGSGDEYVVETKEKRASTKGKVGHSYNLQKPRTYTDHHRFVQRRAITTDSDTDSDSPKAPGKTTGTTVTVRPMRRASTASQVKDGVGAPSASPEPVHPRRRKSVAEGPLPTPTPKRKRTNTQSSQPQPQSAGGAGGGEDAMRKFCLNKLQEIFVGIFQRYPLLPSEGDEGETGVEKKPEELTDEEKEQLKERASRFATELEECMYELYAEPDKTGKQSVAAKYKYVPLSPSGHILLICADHLQ